MKYDGRLQSVETNSGERGGSPSASDSTYLAAHQSLTCDSMKAFGYVRVSMDKEAERGTSLEAQAEKIKARALVIGSTVGATRL